MACLMKKIGPESCTDNNLYQLHTLTDHLATSILSELCYFPTAITLDFFICEFHLDAAKKNLRERKKKTYCEIPEIYSDHGNSSKRPNRERQITDITYQNIAEKAGGFLPVGTCKFARTDWPLHPPFYMNA